MVTVLKYARLRAGLTLKYVAGRLGISFQHLSNLENGKEPIRFEYYVQLGKLYGVSAELLARGKIEITQ